MGTDCDDYDSTEIIRYIREQIKPEYRGEVTDSHAILCVVPDFHSVVHNFSQPSMLNEALRDLKDNGIEVIRIYENIGALYGTAIVQLSYLSHPGQFIQELEQLILID